MQQTIEQQGEKKKLGRHPVKDKKIQILVYILQSEIDAMGGKDELRTFIGQSVAAEATRRANAVPVSSGIIITDLNA